MDTLVGKSGDSDLAPLTGAAGIAAEIYDPTSGRFRATGRMAIAGGRHNATLLNSGKILLATATVNVSRRLNAFAAAQSIAQVIERRTHHHAMSQRDESMAGKCIQGS